MPAGGGEGKRGTVFPVRLVRCGVVVALAALACSAAGAAEHFAKAPAPEPLDFQHVQGAIHVIAASGSNVTIQAGENGVLLVNTGDGSRTDEVLERIKEVSARRINHIVNTNGTRWHIGGNARTAAAGISPAVNTDVPVEAEAVQAAANEPREDGALIHAHENLLLRLRRNNGAGVDPAAYPNRAFFTASKKFSYNDEPVELLHIANAITDGDVIVFFRKSDVISTGSLFSTASYPAIEPESGGSLAGVIEGLNQIIDIAVPKINQEGGTRIIPSEGRVSNEIDVVEYRDMLTIVRNRIRDLLDRGMSLEQVIQAKPTLDYDGIYDRPATDGKGGARAFIALVYAELSAKQ